MLVSRGCLLDETCFCPGQKVVELCFAEKNGEFGLSCAPLVLVSQAVLVTVGAHTELG